MFEVEKKYRISKTEYDSAIQNAVANMGFDYNGYENTISYYWPTIPGETFRICRITENGVAAKAFYLCTYKQKKNKTARLEFEERIPTFVADGFLRISPALYAMTRCRKKFSIKPFGLGSDLTVHVELDWVTAPEELIGYYAEIEVMRPSEDDLFAADALIDAYAKQLGLDKQETRSYFKMLKDAAPTKPR